MINEVDTCRKFVLPKLRDAGWDDVRHHIREQWSFTDGKIVVIGGKAKRRPQKRADYVLRYTLDFPIAVVEAKAAHKSASDGMQQAKEYAEILGLKFAYSTNGREIMEYDFTLGTERRVDSFPTPDELWQRYRSSCGLDETRAGPVLTPTSHSNTRPLRYYQEIAVNRAVEAITKGQRRALLTMATGTGKTLVAFQVCWKLSNARWNTTGEHRKPRMLYLADRTFLVDDPKDKYFAPFGGAVTKIEGEANLGREMYFATYQSIAGDGENGTYRQFPADFFDLIVVDECHRGSARDDSLWREVLEYFSPAAQLGMTATPLRDETRNTYQYFGAPLYTYSLRQGIEDGFLAPYRVHRVITSWDAVGWRPSQEDIDRYGRQIPDELWETPEFERAIALLKRTEAIAHNLAGFMRQGEHRFDKTMVFCVDQEHADEMRRALANENADLLRGHPDYVCRVTADEGQIGKAHLGRFQDPENETPVILTTSQLLTTGVDAPSCRNIVLARVINSMTEFKQIIGRGTRIHKDSEKLFFNIIDYTGSATRLFADPAFDGDPSIEIEQEMDEGGGNAGVERILQPEPEEEGRPGEDEPRDEREEDDPADRRKFYYDGGHVEIVAHIVYDIADDGTQLRVVSYSDYTAQEVRTLYTSISEMRSLWVEPERRAEVLARLSERGIDFEELAEATDQPGADPFDLLCHVAFNAPLRTRRERAERLRRERSDFFDKYRPQAREVLEQLLEKYAEHGAAQFKLPDVLYVPPVSSHGNVPEITAMFGGAAVLRDAVRELQQLLYATEMEQAVGA